MKRPFFATFSEETLGRRLKAAWHEPSGESLIGEREPFGQLKHSPDALHHYAFMAETIWLTNHSPP